MVLLLERENGTPPLSHHDQWRRGFACKTDADCSSAPALDEPCSPIGLAGTGAIPEPEMNSRFFFLQAAAAVWTFSRVFLHNGACPAAVHIIACDYLPSHDSSYLGAETCREFELKQENIPTLLCKRFFFMPFASRFCRITQLPQYFRGSNLNIPYYATSILGFEVFCFFFASGEARHSY